MWYHYEYQRDLKKAVRFAMEIDFEKDLETHHF